MFDSNGERGRNRTYNLLIKSQLLCQLSYAPAREVLAAGATLASPKISITSPAPLSLHRYRLLGRQRRGGNLCDVQQPRRRRRKRAQSIAEHRLAERAGRADHIRARPHQTMFRDALGTL